MNIYKVTEPGLTNHDLGWILMMSNGYIRRITNGDRKARREFFKELKRATDA